MENDINKFELSKNEQAQKRKNASAGNFQTRIGGEGQNVRSNSGYYPQRTAQNAPQRSSTPQRNVSQPVPQRRAANPNAANRAASQTQARRTAPSATAQRPNAANQASTAKSTNSRQGKPSSQPQKRNSQPQRRRMTVEEMRMRREQKRRARIKSLVAFVVCVLFISIITVSLSVVAINTLNDLLSINKDSGQTVPVVVEEGDDFDAVFDHLCDSGLVNSKLLSKLFCKYRKYDTVKYEPGVYYFDNSDGVETMLESIKVSSGVSSSIVRLTFPEGWSIAKIFKKIEKYEVCTAEKLYANLDIVSEQYKFHKSIKSSSGRYLDTEGYLFPDTYEFYIGESASSVLKKLFANFDDKWTSEYSQKAKALGMNKDQIITIASIIQREAANAEQMKDISSVIHNRLRSSAFEYLQCDSTADYIYSMNKDFEIFNDYDYSLYYESYNTYSNKGLPPGPICNPGIKAIEAALEPNDTSYYYFAHDESGQIYLASTESEHQANVAQIFSGSSN